MSKSFKTTIIKSLNSVATVVFTPLSNKSFIIAKSLCLTAYSKTVIIVKFMKYHWIQIKDSASTQILEDYIHLVLPNYRNQNQFEINFGQVLIISSHWR